MDIRCTEMDIRCAGMNDIRYAVISVSTFFQEKKTKHCKLVRFMNDLWNCHRLSSHMDYILATRRIGNIYL
ncbi:Hypothetical predicted protein [Octopus vulgaris]|uniref:Uncharacterized protein n=1 Tax=Octopus vulgaris TaxID=6645 RepID=A0AA36EXN5_OCTVU|nr:Hypothetical predicted protein [Octopus vulgaris]